MLSTIERFSNFNTTRRESAKMNLLNVYLYVIICLFQVYADGRNFKRKSKRIYGGYAVRVEEFPFYVRLSTIVKGDRKNCGGTLIKNFWVLTAAHCVDFSLVDPNFELSLFAGVDNLNDPARVHMRTPKELINHPKYGGQSVYNDIALVKLNRPFKLGERINTLSLPMKHEEITFKSVTAVGFGSTVGGSHAPLSGQLLAVKLDLFIDDKYCRKNQASYEPQVMFCAGVKEGGKDTCNGDSGGPIIGKRINNDAVLIGITSFASNNSCGEKDLPAFYTRVSTYIDWINQTIMEYSNV